MKDVKGYEGLYAMHPSGKVYSYKNKKFLKAGKHRDGYLQVVLYKDGKMKTCKVHRLVALTYIDNPENKPQVNHKDGNKTNNNVSNLEWVTHGENQKHAYDNGLKENCRKVGKQNGVKYCSKQVEVTFPNGETKTYYSSLECARELDLPLSTVRICINYRNGYYKKRNLRFRYIGKEK